MTVVVVGSYVQDFVWRTATLPSPGESRIGQFSTGPGGKGFNQAVAAHRQDIAVRFIGGVGRDAQAMQARQYAEAFMLPAHWIDTDANTATASVVVDQSGANLICVALGANAALPIEAIEAQQDSIANAKVLVTQLEANLLALARAVLIAKTGGALCILNPAPINADVTQHHLAMADVLTPNETEFAFLMKHLHDVALPDRWWTDTDAKVHAWCRKLSSNTVVITLGGEGVFVSHAPYRMRGDSHFCYRMAAETALAVDTTGAGDAFNGGLAAGLMHHTGEPFSHAVRYANRVAALSVEKPGAALSMPTRQDVLTRFV